MPVESARHCFVKKLVIASIFVTGFFGVGSILYGSIQSRHEKALTLNKNIRALRMSLSIDKIYNLTQSKFEGTTCLLSNPATCKVLIENLITTLNRLEDYEIVALSTIGLSKRSEAVIKL